MIELNHDQLTIRFPAIEESLRQRIRAWVDAKVVTATSTQRRHLPATGEELYRAFLPYPARAEVKVSFQRTLRIPDDGKDYPLPPGLGEFPLRHVDDFAATPAEWKKSGGVMLPMHRTEAMWLSFDSNYPMALRVGAGGVCAVSGQTWSTGLTAKPQNYLVLPSQPWLDGFRVSENVIRQFVAVPLGKGLTVEQQITGQESWGGLQLQAFPMHEDIHWQRTVEPRLRSTCVSGHPKPASDGHLKTGHPEGLRPARLNVAQGRDEPPLREPATIDSYLSCPWLVRPTDRPGA